MPGTTREAPAKEPLSQRRAALGQAGALAGRAAPPLFALGLVLTTWAQWDYLRGLGFSLTDHGESAWPSGLAQGPTGWAQVLNYGVYGGLLLVFFVGLAAYLPRRRASRVAGVLLVASAVGWLLVAFPEDGPPFGEPTTWSGYAHGIGFLVLILFGTGGIAATAVAQRGDARWRGLALFSAAAATAIFFFLVVLVFALEIATTLGIYGFFITHMAWVGVHAHRLARLTHG